MTAARHEDPTAIHPVAIRDSAGGLRLLVLRQFEGAGAPPAFAFIEQHLLRAPGRGTRHGVFFAPAFLPDVMDWLIGQLGRPSLRRGDEPARRNPRWPDCVWESEARSWPDGTLTLEWHVDIVFPEPEIAASFRERWRQPEVEPVTPAPGPS